MDWGEVGGNLIIVLLIFCFFLLSIYFRARRGRKTPLGMVVTLLSEINQNQRLLENFDFHLRTKKFKTDSWERNKSKLDFLPQELLATLSHAFSIAKDFNEKIDTARKYKSTSYMASIELDKLKLPLAKGKQQLKEWLEANLENPEYHPKGSGFFS